MAPNNSFQRTRFAPAKRAADCNPLVAWREAPHNHADQADSRHPSADGDAGFSRRDHRLSVKTR